MDDRNQDGKPLSKWQYLQHRKSIMPKFCYKEWQIMLGLHSMLVTLLYTSDLQLVLSKTNRIGDTK